MTVQQAQQKLLFQLYQLYDRGEAAAISNLVMEDITGWKRIDRVINKSVSFSISQAELFDKYYKELSVHRPVQYVLGKARFCGMEFYVDENVLIPRAETEELIEWVVAEVKSGIAENVAKEALPGHSEHDFTYSHESAMSHEKLSILDIGTGSGCIPISLKIKLPWAVVCSCDLSEKALEVAVKNAVAANTEIEFRCLDFLDVHQRETLRSYNILVSNPPYIPWRDRESMPENVVNFEPSTALFVEDTDPLVFYKAIADFAIEKLLPGGSIFAEIHEDFFSNVKELFLQRGFSTVTVRKDVHGKNRMVKATLLL